MRGISKHDRFSLPTSVAVGIKWICTLGWPNKYMCFLCCFCFVGNGQSSRSDSEELSDPSKTPDDLYIKQRADGSSCTESSEDIPNKHESDADSVKRAYPRPNHLTLSRQHSATSTSSEDDTSSHDEVPNKSKSKKEQQANHQQHIQQSS